MTEQFTPIDDKFTKRLNCLRKKKKKEKCAPENEFENLFECLVIMTKILNEILSSRYFASLLVISTN